MADTRDQVIEEQLEVAGPTKRASEPTSKGSLRVTQNERRLEILHPIVAARARCMLDLCAQAGITLLITQGLRDWAEQDALYARGRTVEPIGPKHIVTKAKGGQSYHNFGLAFDIAVLDDFGKATWDSKQPAWIKAAAVGKSVGFEWGGDWKSFRDIPHFQYVGGISITECRALYTEGGLDAIWRKVH